jgi:hypothetical protein
LLRQALAIFTLRGSARVQAISKMQNTLIHARVNKEIFEEKNTRGTGRFSQTRTILSVRFSAKPAQQVFSLKEFSLVRLAMWAAK